MGEEEKGSHHTTAGWSVGVGLGGKYSKDPQSGASYGAYQTCRTSCKFMQAAHDLGVSSGDLIQKMERELLRLARECELGLIDFFGPEIFMDSVDRAVSVLREAVQCCGSSLPELKTPLVEHFLMVHIRTYLLIRTVPLITSFW